MRLRRPRTSTRDLPPHPQRGDAPAGPAAAPELRETMGGERGGAGPAVAAPARAREQEPALAAERRLRDAGGPEDTATYACRCGAVFPASPTTSVACPLCGVHQAW